MGSATVDGLSTDVCVRPDVCELSLVGEIDIATAPLVAEAARRLDESGSRPVVLDVGGVTFCDARGVAALLALNSALAARGREVTLCRPPPGLLWVLRLCGAVPALRFRSAAPSDPTL